MSIIKNGRMLTHEAIVNREKRKYDKDWLTFTEIAYGGFIFDLFAFNPKTKEVEITEVDLSSVTPPEKIKFAESFAKIKIFRSLGNTKIQRKDFQSLIDAVSHPIRVSILEALYDNGTKTYSELAQYLRFDLYRKSGSWAYHFKLLNESKLILRDNYEKYGISQKGQRIIEFFRELNKST